MPRLPDSRRAGGPFSASSRRQSLESGKSEDGNPKSKAEEASPKKPLPQEQGWTQRTDRGRMYLSRREENVFVLEGTTASGVSAACTYRGSKKECEILDSSDAFSLFCELKIDGSPGEVYILLDVQDLSDLSSGCDFLAVKLSTATRELKLENRRKKSRESETVFSLPNCNMLRPNSYINLRADVSGDTMCSLSLNGVVLLRNVNLNRSSGSSLAHSTGVATYGKSRAYLRRFRFEKYEESVANRNDAPTDLQIVPVSDTKPASTAIVPAVTSPGRGSSSRGGGTGSSATNAQPHFYGTYANNGVPSLTPPVVPHALSEELELAQLIERDVILRCEDVGGSSEARVTFDDIGGLDQAKAAINESIILPLLVPEMFTGIRQPWRGVLLYGPPGNGKTMLAKAVAHAASSGNLTFFNCSCATLTSKWRGESEKLLRTLFSMARAKYPSILFFDEVDSLLSTRGSGGEHEASRRFKSEFLIHMDGIISESSRTPLVLCTSNTPWDLDDALRRRLEKRIYVPFPDEKARKFFFENNMKDSEVSPDFDPGELAKATEGYSGADIKGVCREASMAPLRRGLSGLSAVQIKELREQPGGLKPSPVTQEDFYQALMTMGASISQVDVQKYERWTEEFGIR